MSDNVIDCNELRAIVERLESFHAQRKEIGELISDELKVADSKGYDKKAIKELLRLRKMEDSDRQSSERHRLAYIQALGLDDIL